MRKHYESAALVVAPQGDIETAMGRLADDANKLQDALEIEHGVPVRFEHDTHNVVVAGDSVGGWVFHATALIHFSHEQQVG
ncbi:MAG: hypothetical protein ACXVGQ_10760 [Mycobacteriaceae bacterium]